MKQELVMMCVASEANPELPLTRTSVALINLHTCVRFSQGSRKGNGPARENARGGGKGEGYEKTSSALHGGARTLHIINHTVTTTTSPAGEHQQHGHTVRLLRLDKQEELYRNSKRTKECR